MKLTDKQKKAVKTLQSISPQNEIFWDDQGKYPKFIKGKLSRPLKGKPETVARKFLDENKDLLDFQKGLKEKLKLSHIEKNQDGSHHVYFQQFVNDLQVFEGSTQVHINASGEVIAYKDYRLTQIDIPLKPAIDKKSAIRVALNDLGKSDVQTQAGLTLYRDKDITVHLSWEVEINIEGELGARWYFIDAHSGELLYKYAQIRGALSRMTYTAKNKEVIPGELIIKDEQTGSDEIGQAAHDHAKIVYDYYMNTFGRDSYDDHGATLKSTVHFKQDYNNAFWSDWYEQMVYGDGDGFRWKPLALALDIVGHELTHAVTARTARFVYAEEAGALDEAFADIFGVMVSNEDPITNWEMGEGVFTPFKAGDALRDLSDPTKYDQPDHMDNFWHLSSGELPDPDKNDNGWVHINSGIPNKAFYLIVAGGTHHGIRVQGIGKQKAEQIFYLALTVYLSSSTRSRWTFMQARYAMLNACRQLFGDDGDEYRTVKNACAAVGIGEPAVEFTVVEQALAPYLPIPDFDPTGIRSTMYIPQQGRLNEVSLSLNIDHTYIGDLRVTLVSPSGQQVLIHDREGGSSRDIDKTYDFSGLPALQTFAGEQIQGNWVLEVSDNARVDTGKLARWALKIVTQKAVTRTLNRQATPQRTIPDNDPAGIESTITVSASGEIVNLDISVDIVHPYIGDLQVVLQAPTADEVFLHNRTGYSRKNIKKTFSTKSDGVLHSLLGVEIKGKWKLKVMDLAGRDVGQLNRWSLRFIYR